MTSPARCRQAVEQVQNVLGVSERRACRVLKQPRSTQRYQPIAASDTAALTARLIALASEYGRYGYRRITALLHKHAILESIIDQLKNISQMNIRGIVAWRTS